MSVPPILPSVLSLSLCSLLDSTYYPLSISHCTDCCFCIIMSTVVSYFLFTLCLPHSVPSLVLCQYTNFYLPHSLHCICTSHSNVHQFCVIMSSAVLYCLSTVWRYLTLYCLFVLFHYVHSFFPQSLNCLIPHTQFPDCRQTAV